MILPVQIPISGTIDQNGNASIPVKGTFTDKWSMLMVTIRQVQNINGVLTPVGRPDWVMLVEQDVMAVNSGPSTELGPRPVPPKAKLTINVTNGTVGAQIVGTVHGTYTTANDPHEILQSAYAPSPNTIAASVASLSGGTSTALNAPGGDTTIQIPAGTTYVGFLISGNATESYNIIGVQTGFIYIAAETLINVATGSLLYPRYIRLLSGDTALTFHNNGGVALTGTVTFFSDSNSPQEKQSAGANRTWIGHCEANGSGSCTVNTTGVSGFVSVLDYALFSVQAGASRVFPARLWDGTVGGPGFLGQGLVGDPSASLGGTTDHAAFGPGLRSTGANGLGFDLGFAAAAGEQLTIIAYGHYEHQ